jgi:hypothetical protein
VIFTIEEDVVMEENHIFPIVREHYEVFFDLKISLIFEKIYVENICWVAKILIFFILSLQFLILKTIKP